MNKVVIGELLPKWRNRKDVMSDLISDKSIKRVFMVPSIIFMFTRAAARENRE